MLLPATAQEEVLREMLDIVDGLVLTGGDDIGGEYFGEPTHPTAQVDPFRDTYDFALVRLAADRQLPVLGICRGMQVINIAFGGDIWQDLPSQYPGRLENHRVLTDREKPCHSIEIVPETFLSSIVGDMPDGVNSRHHQAVRAVAPGFRVSARSHDGVIEAIEAYPQYRILGVQWHPENMAVDGGSKQMRSLFRFFTGEAALFKQAKYIHTNNLTVDSHCDTPMLFADNHIDIGSRSIARVDLVKMEEGRMDAVFVVAYIPQGPLDENGREQAFDMAMSLLEQMQGQIKSNESHVGQASSFAEADRLKSTGRKSIFLGVENGYAIGVDISKLERFRDAGVVYITLCHNGANDICDSAVGEALHGGLSRFGREIVAEMNRLGMVIDLSHSAESTFYDVLEMSSAPVICSHSSARALCDHPRNLTDSQIRELAAKGGVVQVCLYGGFLASGREAGIEDALYHIDHIVKTGGIECVGIGSDFDGGGGIAGCNGANEIINIMVGLLRRGYSGESIAKILGGNLRRVVDSVQSSKTK